MKTSAILLLIVTALTLPLNAAKAINDTVKSDFTSKTKVGPSFLKSINEVEERTLEISDWMLDVTAFERKSEMIEIEDWMLDTDAFSESSTPVGIRIINLNIFEEYEEETEIDEKWIYNLSVI